MDSTPSQQPPQEADLDTSIDADITQETTQPDSMQIDSTIATDTMPSTSQPAADPEIPTTSEPRIPAKKDASLREFLGKMDDYSPMIPDAVTNYYLTLAGLPPPPQTPVQLTRLLSLATQKFIADIAADAYQYARIRSSNTTTSNPMGVTAAPGVGAPPGGGGAGGPAGREADKNKNLGVQRPGYGGGGQGGAGQGRTVLTMEDLGMAVGEYGVNVKRGEFYR